MESLAVRAVKRLTWYEWLTWAFCIGVLVLAARFGRNQNSAWILLTAPDGNALYDNSLFGYCHLLGRSPFMKENEPTLHQVAFFSGVRGQEATLDFYALRCGYTVLATMLTPLMGVLDALAVTNWLVALLCVWSVWKLSRRLFKDPGTSCWAAVLACLGMGVWTHIGDYSAHLAAFASYFLGIYLIYASGLIYKRRPWRTHLILGAYCACACLVYKSGIMLVGVYLLASLRHNRWRHVLAATLLALSALPVWKYCLTLQGAAIVEVESDYLRKSLQGWLTILRQPWHEAAMGSLFRISQFLLFESPLVVCLGLGSMFFLPQRRALRWYGALVVGLPLASGMVFVNSASARGYLVYGISIWFYCWLARLLTLFWRADGRWRKVAGLAMIVLILGSHAAWTTAFQWRQLGPIKAYVLGWDNAWFHFKHGPTQVLSLTDQEPTPRIWGGRAALDKAGAVGKPSKRPVTRDMVSFGLAFIRRSVCFAYVGLFALAAAVSLRGRVLLAGAVACTCVISATLSAATFRHAPVVHDITGPVALPAGDTLLWQAEVGPEFQHALQSLKPEDQIQVFLQADHETQLAVRVRTNKQDIPIATYPAKPHAWHPADNRLARAALATASCLVVEIQNCSDQPVHLGAWQPNSLAGRRQLVFSSCYWEKPFLLLVGIEIRIVRPDKTFALVGF